MNRIAMPGSSKLNSKRTLTGSISMSSSTPSAIQCKLATTSYSPLFRSFNQKDGATSSSSHILESSAGLASSDTWGVESELGEGDGSAGGSGEGDGVSALPGVADGASVAVAFTSPSNEPLFPASVNSTLHISYEG